MTIINGPLRSELDVIVVLKENKQAKYEKNDAGQKQAKTN